MMKITCLFVLVFLLSCGQTTQTNTKESHIAMPEKDKDGEKSKDKEDFGRLMEKLGGKDFVDNMKTSSEKLLNSNLEKEQENAIESGFVGSEKPILESFPHVLMGAPESYEHFRSQLPEIKTKLTAELRTKSLKEKEAILEGILKEFNQSLSKNHPDKFDFRLVAWFMQSFTKTVYADVVGKLYERILFRGNLITKEYIFENNFMEKHAFDLGPILDFYYVAFQDSASPHFDNGDGKSTPPGEIEGKLKDAVNRSIEVAEDDLSPQEKEKRARARNERYVNPSPTRSKFIDQMTSFLSKMQLSERNDDLIEESQPVYQKISVMILNDAKFEDVEARLPQMEKSLKKEISQMSQELKESTLSDFNPTKDEDGKPKDFRILAWFMRFFSDNLDSIVIQDLYLAILKNGDNYTKTYLVENNFSDAHVFDMVPLLTKVREVFVNLAAKYAYTSNTSAETLRQWSTLLTGYIANANQQLPSYVKQERDWGEGIAALRKWMRQLYEKMQNPPYLSFNLEEYVEKAEVFRMLKTRDIIKFYIDVFAFGNYQTRLKLLELMSKPHAVDFMRHQVFESFKYKIDSYPAESEAQKEDLIRKIDQLRSKYENSSPTE